jgi:NAD(P)-dependent dehydrogenase (short-subunit alcohol dehydrogenase family)
MIKQFEGKVALVTGGGSGIGRATALLFAQEGAKCVIADIFDESGRETVRMIEDAGGEAIFIKCDVSKASEVEALINKTIEAYGRLDCAHNNAAYLEDMALTADLKEEFWDRTISVDLKGVWLCMKYEIPWMLKQGRGAIVNMTSGAALKPVPGACAYNAAKAGVLQLTRTAALEYSKAGIRINAVAPGATRTPTVERLIADHPEVEQMIRASPIGRIAMPGELAEAVVWLCSDDASFVIGSHLVVDGGHTIC